MENKVNVVSLGKDTWQIQDIGSNTCVYLYLLVGQKQAMLIDTGMWVIDVLGIAQSLTDKPVFVVNTHGHLDHISANHLFEEAFLHPADEAVFAAHSSSAARRGFVEGLLMEQGLSVTLLDAPDMKEQYQRVFDLPQRNNRQPLQEGMIFDLGGRHLRVIETPGHTVGSVCLLDIENRWLFTGDTVCDQGVLLHLPYSAPVQTFAESIRKLEAMGNEYDVMWPGHHRCPLEKQILQKYLACAERLQQGESGTKITSAAGTAQILIHDGIALSVPFQE